ncbi:polyprenyl synthetase family protein [Ensifer adhaerens]|uniref:polyprenyl synthetase family protein n=1 Tax=Ensifer adhaerens TaxID=106592 RepID=UPI0023A9C530|nr:farnesyl diphosphate synthase [Ensifer adhaerens]WDZ76471.1 polyprenyl synthetase family protein [Ensifer adhaerens]
MSQDTSSFTRRLANNARAVEVLLERLLGVTTEADEITRPANLLAAMRHGVLNGGKRLRPFLVIECADLLGGSTDAASRVGAALECVHCYSLVHDDLPAMDDDDMRRGQPTVHKAFDEATAILAGDSLLTFAFDVIAGPETTLTDTQKVELILALGRAAGHGGMAGGQALDLAAEKSPPDEAGIVTLQAMKTGALIRFACEAGAIVAGASRDDRARLRSFGEKIGLAFQLADDLLDLTADAATMGKATGKDAARGKGTLVALHGQAWAEQRLEQLVTDAEALLSPYGQRSAILVETARFIANRRS